MAALVDAVKLIGAGNATFKPLSPDAETDLLNTKYAIYVNYETGCDDIVLGNYNADRQQLNQELECGYSPYRPFKSLARAYAEVARRSILAGSSNDINNRAAVFVDLADGYTYNGTGSSSVSAWSEGAVSSAQLQALNDATNPGLILPRGVSTIGRVLRNSVIRPTLVPAGSGNAITGRAPIFRCTGGSFFFNFTFKDNESVASTHHLVHTHEFCDQQDLIEYYEKIMAIFGLTGAEVINPGETEIVAPTPDVPSAAVDDTRGSSPYIFNCSVRSNYGISGPLIDGRDVTGFRSMEAANFSIISLQKDYANAYQKYQGGSWVNVTGFEDYINTDINDLRMKVSGDFDWQTATYQTDYHHFGFKLIGNAFVQEVSEFTIGLGIHHWTASGSDADLTGCNAFAGETALCSHGFSGIGTAGGAFPQDRGFLGIALRRPLQVRQDGSNLRRTTLGQVAITGGYVESGGTAYLKLSSPLSEEAFTQLGITLQADHYIWISNTNRNVGPGAVTGEPENSTAIDVHAQLASVPWSAEYPDRIYVQPGSNNNILADGMTVEELALNSVYVRRLVDSRSASEREYALIVSNTAITTTRKPEAGFVLRLGSRASLATQLDPVNGSDQLFLVDSSAPTTVESPVADTSYFSLVLRPGDSCGSHSESRYYLPGTAIQRNNRIYRAAAKVKPGAFNAEQWVTASRSATSVRGIAHPRTGVAPKITIDKDLSDDPFSVTLGINLTTDADVQGQLQATTDYIAIERLLSALGYASPATILQPQASEATRLFDPSAGSSPIPSGKLTTRAAWPLEFNKPSIIEAGQTIFRHIGRATYAKALPRYQRNPLTDQHRIDACTLPAAGGAVYADGSIENGLRLQGNTLIDLAAGRDVSIELAGIGGLSDSNGEVIDQTPIVEERPYTFQGPVTFEGSTSFEEPIELTGFAESSVPLLKATSSRFGLARLATGAEVTAGLSGASPADGPAVLQPQDLKTVLDQLTMIPDTETILYVDGGITRTNGIADYSSISTAIWTDFKTNRAIHGFPTIWNTTAPAANSDQAALARKLCFSSVKEAFDFLNNRDPISRPAITIQLYGSSYANEGLDPAALAACYYGGQTEVTIARGASATPASGRTWSQPHCTGRLDLANARLVLNNANISIAGRQGNLDYDQSSIFAGIQCKNLRIVTSRLQVYTTTPNGFVLGADVTDTVDILASSDYSVYDNNIEFDIKTRQTTGSTIVPAYVTTAIRAQNSLNIYAWQTVAAGVTQKPLAFTVKFDAQNDASLNGARSSALFIAYNYFVFANAPFGVYNYAGSSFTFNLGPDNANSNNGIFYFLHALTPSFRSLNVTGSGSTSTLSIASIGAFSSVSSLTTCGPSNILALTRTNGSNNTTNFLYKLAKAFRDNGISASNAVAWDLTAGSFRDGYFSSTFIDRVNVT